MTPRENFVNDLFERNKERKIMLIVNIVLLAASAFFIFKGYHMILAITMAIILIINSIRLVLWLRSDEAKIKDTTDCRIKLLQDEFDCVQVNSQSTLEECSIKYRDIEQVVESTKKGERGFYLKLKPKNTSSVYQNEERVDRQVFYVDGIGYDHREFADMYWNLIDRLNDDVVMIGTAKQKSWIPCSAGKELAKLLTPYTLVVGIAILQFIL